MPMTRQRISTDNAPRAVGPYSQGIRAGELVFTAGQIPINPATGAIDAVAIEDQTRQALENVRAVLEAAGSGLDRVVKTTVFMVDLGEFQAMNGVYASFFPVDPPARSAFQVAALPLGAKIEVECVALVG
jgi:2-iminobutanoate/2-iminopropanoate deaminase